MSKEVYSYHTFMFPFLWKCENNSEKQIKIFKRFLDEQEGYWKSQTCLLKNREFTEDMSGFQELPLSEESYAKLLEEARLQYAVYQYYNDPARKAIYGNLDSESSEDDVLNYVFDCKSVAKKYETDATYRIIPHPIEGMSEEEHENGYVLDIHNITLRLYHVGIAILVYELENRNYRSLDAVKAINDYGRRVQLASMKPCQENSFKLTADKISVCGITEDFKGRVQSYQINQQSLRTNPWAKELDYISETVTGLFCRKDGTKVVSFERNETGKLYMEPFVDDRMFVMSLVSDDTLIPFKKVKFDDITSIEECTALSLDNLYEFVFIDP